VVEGGDGAKAGWGGRGEDGQEGGWCVVQGGVSHEWVNCRDGVCGMVGCDGGSGGGGAGGWEGVGGDGGGEGVRGRVDGEC